MKCLCIGICQLGAMVEYMKKSKVFTSIYDDITYYPIFNISVEKMQYIIDIEVPQSDLIISQPVSENYKGNDIFSTKKLRELAIKYGKTHYVVSNCYFTGYDPNPFQTTNKDGAIINYNNISYFPSSSLTQILEGDIRLACIKYNAPDLYSTLELENNYKNTMNELKKREERIFDNDYGIDIRISDFIENNYKIKYLFHTYNHPTNILIYELFKRLLIKLNLPIDNVIIDNEILGNFSIPPPPSVYYKTNMSFEYPKFILNKETYSTKRSMEIFSDALKGTDLETHNRWKSTISWGRLKLKNSD